MALVAAPTEEDGRSKVAGSRLHLDDAEPAPVRPATPATPAGRPPAATETADDATASEPGQDRTARRRNDTSAEATASSSSGLARQDLHAASSFDFKLADLDGLLADEARGEGSAAPWLIASAEGGSATGRARDARPGTGFVQTAAEELIGQLALSPAAASAVAATAGSAWWGLRLTGIVAALVASTPVWRHLDPSPILGDNRRARALGAGPRGGPTARPEDAATEHERQRDEAASRELFDDARRGPAPRPAGPAHRDLPA